MRRHTGIRGHCQDIGHCIQKYMATVVANIYRYWFANIYGYSLTDIHMATAHANIYGYSLPNTYGYCACKKQSVQ